MRSSQAVSYRQVGGVDLQMEIFLPDPPEKRRPGVLFVHGGGWSGGQRSQFLWHARELAGHGFVTASASYRLSGVAPYPAALDDCQCAMRWLRKNADSLRLDPGRIGAFGSSAGGHLVACLGVRETREDTEPALSGYSSRAQAVVDVHGVHDMPSLPADRLVESTHRFLGGDRNACRAAWEDASPLRFVDAESAPMLLIHDPADPTVPYAQSAAFAAALIQAGRPVAFIPTPGSGHGFVYNPEGAWTKRVWPAAVNWLEQALAES